MIRLVSEGSGHSGIAVVGVGGAGVAILNSLIGAGEGRISTVSVTADEALLEGSKAMERILIGRKVTGGRGCGGEPELGRRALLQDIDLVREALEEFDTVVLIAGLGGGTGTGAVPEIASLVREMGMRALSVVTEPLPYEGRRRGQTAERGVAFLRSAVDGVIYISNEGLLSSVSEEVSIVDAFFEYANVSICHVVQSVVRLLEGSGIINADFADIRSVLSVEGRVAMGHGQGSGKRRADHAASAALKSRMFGHTPFNTAGAVLVSFEGSRDMTFQDVNQALKRIAEAAGPGADIVTGAFVNDGMGSRCSATVIATGMGVRSAPEQAPGEEKEPVTWQAKKVEQTVIDFSPPNRGRFADLEPSLYEGEDLDVPTILRRKAR